MGVMGMMAKKKSLAVLVAMAAMTATTAVPAFAQGGADPSSPVSSDDPGQATDTGGFSLEDCLALQATGAEIDCGVPPDDDVVAGDGQYDAPVSGAPGDGPPNDRAECERFNRQYGTEIGCSILPADDGGGGRPGVVSGDMSNGPGNGRGDGAPVPADDDEAAPDEQTLPFEVPTPDEDGASPERQNGTGADDKVGAVVSGDTSNDKGGGSVVVSGGAVQGGASPMASVLPATGGVLPVAGAAGLLIAAAGLLVRKISR